MSPEAKKDSGGPGKSRHSSQPTSKSKDREEAAQGASVSGPENGARTPPEDPAAEAAATNRAGLLAALRTGLEEVLPGMRLLDRDLEFEEGARADLAGVDATGRLVLVLVAEEDLDRTALLVLDTHSFASRQTAAIVRHIGADGVDAQLPPRTLVIDAQSSERLLLRLSPLFEAGVELYGLQSIRSAAGDRSYLVPRGVRTAASVASGVDPLHPFLDALPAALSELGREVVAQISRLDRELTVAGTPSAVAWSLLDEVLVRLECTGHELVGRVGPHFEGRGIAKPSDLEPLLEGALARLARLPDLDVESEGSGPGDLERDDSPILTAEEIEYFRD